MQITEEVRDRVVLVGLNSPVLKREETADEETMAELAALVKDAPYVNYCFRVPEGGCTDPSRFAIEMGISFQEWWRDLTPDVLPAGMTHYGGRRALVTRIELGDEPLFTYEQLDFVREHCAREGLRLTGEVMVFPRISFLEQDTELLSANLFFFLDC